MTVSTNAHLAYGIDLGEDLPEKLEKLKFDGELPDFQFGYGVEILTHCSNDYPQYFVALANTEWMARRGYPEELPEDALKLADPNSDQILKKFCDDFGIEWKQPAWHLFSMWD